jgi:hypothetical protein
MELEPLFLPEEIALLRTQQISLGTSLIQDLIKIVKQYENFILITPGVKVNCLDTLGRVFEAYVKEVYKLDDNVYAVNLHFFTYEEKNDVMIKFFPNNLNLTLKPAWLSNAEGQCQCYICKKYRFKLSMIQ